jgi:two-component system, NarL family, sensor histidine kinase EvgS
MKLGQASPRVARVVRLALGGLLALAAGLAFAQAQPVFTAEEQRWIKASPVVRYAADTNLQPLEYAENGRFKGLIAEYVDAVARKSGLRFELLPTQNWQEAQQAFLEGKVDMFPNVNAERTTDAVSAKLQLTAPYFLAPTIIVTRTDAPIILDMKDLDGKVVAVRGGGSYARVFADRYPGVRMLHTADPGEGLDAVVAGDAYATVGTDAILLPMMRRKYAGQLAISGTIGDFLYSAQMGVRTDRPLLHAILVKSLGSLSAVETDQMHDRWLEQTDFGKPSLLSIIEYRLPQLLMLLAGVALLGWFAYRARVSQRAAQESERTKSRFLAVMSHEIRTPMNAVLASIEMLQHTPMDARQQRFAHTASVAAEALLSLLDDVLDLSKLDAKRLELELVPTDVDALAQKVAHVARVNAQAKSLQVEVATDNPSGHQVLIDPTRLRQVLLNLLGNAVKFTEHGRIDVALKVADLGELRGQLTVTVSDTGVGIAPSQQAAIFDAYSQADSSTTRRYGGTGLGLTICKELVELMGGEIRLQSRVGAGTSVDFTLPVRLVPPPMKSSEDTSAANGAPASGARADVLVVEDHPGNQFIIAEQLHTLGYETRIVADGQAALAALEEHAFDLVLMDCHMPGMSGYETTRHLREREAGVEHMPVIAISAATDAEHLDKCMESGMDGVLKKPLRLDELSSMLQLWLDHGPSSPRASGNTPPSLAPSQIHDAMAEDLAALRRAFANGDMALAAHHAHRIRGASLMADAAAGAVPAEALEAIARGHAASAGVAALLDELERALAESGLLPLQGPDVKPLKRSVSPSTK